MRLATLALGIVALGLAAGCDTRPTCEVACGNEVRCGLADPASCPSMCGARIATSSSDCRVAADTYHRCWSAQNSCPVSSAVAAPGCSAEFNQRALVCVGGAPLLSIPDGI
jgi:hypothetical protein